MIHSSAFWSQKCSSLENDRLTLIKLQSIPTQRISSQRHSLTVLVQWLEIDNKTEEQGWCSGRALTSHQRGSGSIP